MIEKRKSLADETKQQFAGPMPVHEFMEEFMPKPEGEEVPSFPRAKDAFADIDKQGSELQMYERFVSGIFLTRVHRRSFAQNSSGHRNEEDEGNEWICV